MTRPAVLRPSDVAERWQVSEQHVRNLYRKGELPGFRLGGKLLRFKLEDVELCERTSAETPGTSSLTTAPADLSTLRMKFRRGLT